MLPTVLRLALALLFGTGLLSAQGPRIVRIAAAADLKWALEEAKAAFEHDTPGIACTLTFGSSGNFYTQLTQKAPFDLFLSADMGYPEQLAAQGLGLKESLFPYAVGHLVLWVPKASPIPVESLGLKAVLHPAARKLAIANPRHAPYGRAAEAALKAAGHYDGVQAKLVLGENIAQTAQFVQTGNADLGFIALSLATSSALKGQGRFWSVPAGLHPPLVQGGVILPWTQDVEAARAFRAFLTGPQGLAILERYGFARPGGK
jgi:molybdate transport system substrate-binding protein